MILGAWRGSLFGHRRRSNGYRVCHWWSDNLWKLSTRSMSGCIRSSFDEILIANGHLLARVSYRAQPGPITSFVSCPHSTARSWSHHPRSPSTDTPMRWLIFSPQRPTPQLPCLVRTRSLMWHTPMLVVWTCRSRRSVKLSSSRWRTSIFTNRLVGLKHSLHISQPPC